MGELFGILVGAFFELLFICLNGFLQLGIAILSELFSAIADLAMKRLYITMPTLVIIVMIIFLWICLAIFDKIRNKRKPQSVSIPKPVSRSPVVYPAYNYDDDDDYYDDDEDDEEEEDFMANVHHSEVGLFGDEVYYDKYGHKIGHAETGLLGDKVYYDKNGGRVMRDEMSVLGDRVYYDNSNRVVGRSEMGLLGDRKIYDKNRNLVGTAEKGLFGNKKYHKK